jgi:hypothetical protein
VSEDVTETGKFFGEVEGNAMNMLIKEQVFRKVHIFDYQAICLREDGSTNDASFVITVSSKLHGKLQAFSTLKEHTLRLCRVIRWLDSRYLKV